ncbi:NUDIX domain-containing protein [Sphingosinicella sp.]|uniref:NUDIX domain-containing protein n=1 Tax=Sphingosinicella sp. TaxID=1917971 RepID=UPI004037912B
MKNAVIQFLYRCRRLALRVLRLKTRGVKVMVFNPAGELLLVRNAYGKSHLVLPGGGIGFRESPADAGAREVREETGVAVERLRPVSVHRSQAEGKRDTIHLFTARGENEPHPDGVEVTEARFFPLDSLPDNVSKATLRRIAEYRGEQPVSESW